jgi:hypothetical protein
MTDTTDAAAIIDALKDKANAILGSALGSTPLQSFAIGSLGNFYYNWQDTSDVTKFNPLTYDWIIANLKAKAMPLQLDVTSFTNLYLEVLPDISWSLSTADQATLAKDGENATQQAAALQNAWLAAYKAFPTGAGEPIDLITGQIATTWASPATDLPTMQISLNLRKLLNKMPASGAPILPVLTNWLNALSTGLSLQNSVSINNAYLSRALDAAQKPTATNGGLALSDGTVQPAYQVANQVADIQNALASGPTISSTMTVSVSSDSEFKVSVDGSTDFDIPVADFLDISVGGSASYFSDHIMKNSTSTTVTMSFPGVNLVNFGPVPFQMTGASSSWFSIDPVRHAVANGSHDVSGFKFSVDPAIVFSEAGPFGYVMGVAISGYPTIVITTTTSDYASIQKTFEQNVTSEVSFLGISLASASESTYSNSVKVDEKTSTVTITIAPPQDLVSGTVNSAQAWVLGVQPNYPAA